MEWDLSKPLKFKRYKEEVVYIELYDKMRNEEDYLYGKGKLSMEKVTEEEEEMKISLLNDGEEVGVVLVDVMLGPVPVPGVLIVTPLMAIIRP